LPIFQEEQDSISEWNHRNPKPDSTSRNNININNNNNVDQVVMRRRKPETGTRNPGARAGMRNSGIETDVGDEMMTKGKIVLLVEFISILKISKPFNECAVKNVQSNLLINNSITTNLIVISSTFANF
jgi:hypothetical protein